MREFDPNEIWYMPTEVAAILQVTVQTLTNWRNGNNRRKYGPPFLKIGGAIRYAASDLSIWLTDGSNDIGLVAGETWKRTHRTSTVKDRPIPESKVLIKGDQAEACTDEAPFKTEQTPPEPPSASPDQVVPTVAQPTAVVSDLDAAVSAIVLAVIATKRLFRRP